MSPYAWHPRCFFWERRLVGALAPVDDPAGPGLAGDLADGRWEYRWLHRYIRAGDTLITYSHKGTQGMPSKVLRIEGWGKYAAVMLDPIGAIRRDQIKKDAAGNWFYRYYD